jgi:capsid protein
VLERIYPAFLDAALTFGLAVMPNGSSLSMAKRDKFSAHQFQGRRWEWVDPKKDIDADLTAVDAGVKSPQMIAAKLGVDYEDVLSEIKAAQDMREAMGIQLPARGQQQQQQQPQPADDGEDGDKPTKE